MWEFEKDSFALKDDKLSHMGMCFLFMHILYRLDVIYFPAGVLVFGCGIFVEIYQVYVKVAKVSLHDIAYNFFGIILAGWF